MKIGRLLELNDPFDCFPRLINIRSLNDDEDLNSFATRFRRRFSTKFGVVCYSKTISDPVLWSHYAESNKGIALGFKYPEAHPLVEVIYQTNRMELDAGHLTEASQRQDMETVKRLLSAAFRVKAKSWKYEAEYREFIELDTAYLKGRHYFQILPYYLDEVVIAARSPLEVCDIETCLWKRPGNAVYPRQIVIRKARMSEKKYAIEMPDNAPRR